MPWPNSVTASLTQEIATAAKDPLAATFGARLLPQDDTLASRGGAKGLTLYDELERDPTVFAAMQKRKLALLARAWEVSPASASAADRRAADLVTRQLAALNFDQICWHLLDAILKGYAVAEVLWRVDGAALVAAEIRPRAARRFCFRAPEGASASASVGGAALRLLTTSAPWEGEPLPDRKFLVHRVGAKDDNPYGLGLGTRLFWPVWFKRQGLQFWLTFADKFGTPTAVGTYPPGTPPEDQAKLLAALGAIAQDTGIIMPEGMRVELLEATRGGRGDVYESLCRYFDSEIGKIVLSDSEGGRDSGGALAAMAILRNEARLELIQADADLLSATLNGTLIRWISELNVPEATPPTVWRDIREPEDLKLRAERDRLLVEMGFRPTLAYITETYGGEWTEARKQRRGDTGTGASTFAEAPTAVVDQYAEQLAQRAAPAWDAVVDAVQRLVAEADSLPAVAEGLLALYPEMDPQQMGQAMHEAFTAAQLAGRFELLEETR